MVIYQNSGQRAGTDPEQRLLLHLTLKGAQERSTNPCKPAQLILPATGSPFSSCLPRSVTDTQNAARAPHALTCAALAPTLMLSQLSHLV